MARDAIEQTFDPMAKARDIFMVESKALLQRPIDKDLLYCHATAQYPGGCTWGMLWTILYRIS